MRNTQNYYSNHFPNTPNYVAHARLNERTDAAGKPGLFLEEIQSDRHQAGREKGYREDAQGFDDWMQSKGDPLDTIPDAPFRKDWPMQMFKRALADAVGSGKEWIGWTTGETQAARYDLSKQVDSIRTYKNADGTYAVQAIKDGEVAIAKSDLTTQGLADTIGKDLAGKVVAGQGKNIETDASRTLGRQDREFSGLDLKVGGEGMKGFYDQILPKEISKYVKQWGGQVEKARIRAGTIEGRGYEIVSPEGESVIVGSDRGELVAMAEEEFGRGYKVRQVKGQTPIWRVNITPQMRESIKKAGQALFVGGAAAVVAEEELPR